MQNRLTLVLLVAFVALLLLPVPSAADMVDLTPDTFTNVVSDKNKNVFVLFYAAWCGHCRSFKPTWEQLAEDHPLNGDVIISRIDAAEHREIGAANGVRGYPTIKMFSKTNKDGIVFKGQRDVAALKAFIEEHKN